MAIRKKRKTRASRRWKLHLLSGIWALAVAAVAITLMCDRRGQKDDAAASGDALLKEMSEAKLPPSVPDTLMRFSAFTVHYNTRWLVPNYVVYTLKRSHVGGKACYDGSFFVPEKMANCAMPLELEATGYQRGHMAPAADMRWSEQALRESFAMVNICPQSGDLNTGAWRRLEDRVREWVMNDSVLVVFTGPVLSERMATIGPEHRIGVPERFFKVVLAPFAQPMRAIAFVMPAEGTTLPLRHHAVSVSEVERISGIDFFPTLPQQEQRRLKDVVDTYSWFRY
ncbi:MAG: DNA/RNA non-specific endonuclease [Bacteroidales bacterium]|nr:DNA/RNA non-specific endonuclease [Bacteroidales bacterium]